MIRHIVYNNIDYKICEGKEMNSKKIFIQGSEWSVLWETLQENGSFEICDGYCDPSVKTIHIRKYPDKDEQLAGYESRKYMQEKTLRHEVIHAFMWESGLWRNARELNGDSWSMNEEMVDWIAIQFPKIQKVS